MPSCAQLLPRSDAMVAVQQVAVFVQFNGDEDAVLGDVGLESGELVGRQWRQQLVGLGVALVLSLLRNDHAPGLPAVGPL